MQPYSFVLSNVYDHIDIRLSEIDHADIKLMLRHSLFSPSSLFSLSSSSDQSSP